MTIKEFFESKENLAIHCDTEGKAIKLLTAFDKAGYRWRDGSRYAEEIEWHIHEEYSGYSNNRGYGDISYYEDEGYQVIEFEEINFEDESPESCIEKTQSVSDIAEGGIVEAEPEEDMEREKRIIEEVLKKCAKFFNITNCLCAYTYEYSGRRVTLYTNKPGWWIGYHGNGKTILRAALSTALHRDDIVVDFVELKGSSGCVNFEG